jgi:hypothetical protein
VGTAGSAGTHGLGDLLGAAVDRAGTGIDQTAIVIASGRD